MSRKRTNRITKAIDHFFKRCKHLIAESNSAKLLPETIAVKGEFTVTTAKHEVETYKMGAETIEDNIRILPY